MATSSRKAPPQAPVTPRRNIAIACQGGGSHTAFTAGVLQALLQRIDPSQHRVIGLSGTSGGALCAALAWYDLLLDQPADGARRLEDFWTEMAATQMPDLLTNQFMVWLQRNRSLIGLPEVSPYLLPNSGQDYLTDNIARHLDFERLPTLLTPASPRLMIGAVNVLNGEFTVFDSLQQGTPTGISLSGLLASAAIPELFRAVQIGEQRYWDGLFSQNPPIRGFLSGIELRDEKPDEIWIIRINPESIAEEPRSASDITDRRNELAGNLSLNQEIHFIEQANDWLARGWLPAERFKPIELRSIPLSLDLDYPSKLDRSPEFIATLLEEGRRQGNLFIDRLATPTLAPTP